MLTDGALRMLVLLHFHTLGFSPLQLAYLFVLYEIAGMVTNLGAGWIAARFGLTSTLYAGLGLQVVALIALAQLDPGWAIGASVAFVMAVQGASGVAKDLAKMSSKSAVKLLAPAGEGGLFRWVAVLTGSKNAVKGLGLPAGRGAAGDRRLRLGGAGDGGGAGRRSSWPCWSPCRQACPGSQGCEILRGLLEVRQREPAFGGAGLPVRRARRLVRRRHPDLFLRGAVGRHGGRQPRGVLPHRQLHGALDHPLRRGAGDGAAASARRRRGPSQSWSALPAAGPGRCSRDPGRCWRGSRWSRTGRTLADRCAGRGPAGLRRGLRGQFRRCIPT